MARQKLVATGEIVLPEGMDVFDGVEHAKSARKVLEQAQGEIRKSFPDFAFKFEVGTYRAPGAPKPGRPANTGAAAGNGAAAGQPAA